MTVPRASLQQWQSLGDKRDPYKLYHKMSPEALANLTPGFDWKANLRGPNPGAAALYLVSTPTSQSIVWATSGAIQLCGFDVVNQRRQALRGAHDAHANTLHAPKCAGVR